MRRRRCVRPPHAATRKQKSNVQMITQARFVTFRQAATAAGHPRPPNFRRHFFITVLRPYDTAIHSESKKFIDDLGELGKSLGSDLVRSHDVLAPLGLPPTTRPPPAGDPAHPVKSFLTTHTPDAPPRRARQLRARPNDRSPRSFPGSMAGIFGPGNP